MIVAEVQNYTYQSSSVEFGTKRCYDLGRLQYVGSQDIDLYCHMPVSTFIALFDRNLLKYRQSNGWTLCSYRKHDVHMACCTKNFCCFCYCYIHTVVLQLSCLEYAALPKQILLQWSFTYQVSARMCRKSSFAIVTVDIVTVYDKLKPSAYFNKGWKVITGVVLSTSFFVSCNLSVESSLSLSYYPQIPLSSTTSLKLPFPQILTADSSLLPGLTSWILDCY